MYTSEDTTQTEMPEKIIEKFTQCLNSNKATTQCVREVNKYFCLYLIQKNILYNKDKRTIEICLSRDEKRFLRQINGFPLKIRGFQFKIQGFSLKTNGFLLNN